MKRFVNTPRFATRKIGYRFIIYIVAYLIVNAFNHFLIDPLLYDNFREPYDEFAGWLTSIILLAILLASLFKNIQRHEKISEMYYQYLQKSEENYRKLVETCPDPIALIQEGKFMYMNMACKELFGIEHEDDIKDKKVNDFITEYDKEVSRESEQIRPDKKIELAQRTLIRPYGQERIIETDGALIELDRGKVLQFIARDVTKQKEYERKIESLAYVDELTGLVNRRGLQESLQSTINKAEHSGESFALIILDQDDFKNVNDQYGHDVGDSLLKCVSKRIKNCVRESDVFARMGGDEFCILLSNITKGPSGKDYEQRTDPFVLTELRLKLL